MEASYLSLRNDCESLTDQQVYVLVKQLVSEMVYLDRTILDVSKKWTNTNTWTSHPYIVKSYFGEQLSSIMKEVLSSRTTNNIKDNFSIIEFKDELIEAIYSNVIKNRKE